jgi:glutamate formiminotransferase/formiminotetrahydrofolate cyclodeaminase
MDSPLVECIPNFSEGRRLDVVEQIVAAIRLTSGVFLLDYSSDHDHNRSVVTFVGSPQAVEDAAFAAIAKAAELIDLEKHRGEHPRIGATDVVPFVPIAGITMKECVEIARRLGKRVGEELEIPVYLYEQAATRSDRENLANVRKGEYEGLKDEIKSNPDRAPDFGPNAIGPAGATVIGARSPLIAYNVYLDTDDVSVADKIARAIRHSSGGLRFVKGLGMLVEGKAQVSMNLTDYQRTPVFRVVEMIRREAARYGANITHSELIGLIPQKALIDTAEWHLQLDDFTEEQVLESRIRSAQAEAKGKFGLDVTFLDQLAAGTSTPGGGSAAAYCGAMGAGLVAMVARLTLGKKKYLNVEKRMGKIVKQAEELRANLTASVEKDAAAYDSVMQAFRLPKSTKKETEFRKVAIQKATLGATQAPLEVAKMAVKVLKLASEVAEKGNVNAITDAGSGAALALASFRGAAMNVRINLTSLENKSITKKFSSEIESLEKEAAKLQILFQGVMEERGGMSFK